MRSSSIGTSTLRKNSTIFDYHAEYIVSRTSCFVNVFSVMFVKRLPSSVVCKAWTSHIIDMLAYNQAVFFLFCFSAIQCTLVLIAIFSIRVSSLFLFLLLADSKDTSSAIMQRGVGCPDIDWVSSRTSDDITVCPSGSGRNRLFLLISASEIASHEVSKTSRLTFLPSPNPTFNKNNKI